jgi:hypothetical protein
MYSRTCCPSRETVVEGADCITSTTLHCTTLHYTTLHYTTLHYTTLHFTTLNYTALHCTVLHCTALHCTAPHCTALYHTAPRRATHEITSQHITVVHNPTQTYQHFHPKIPPAAYISLYTPTKPCTDSLGLLIYPVLSLRYTGWREGGKSADNRTAGFMKR